MILPNPGPFVIMTTLLPIHVNAMWQRANNVKEQKQEFVWCYKSSYDKKKENLLCQEGASPTIKKMMIELEALET